MSDWSLNGKIILLTGATGGIGAAAAREMAARGATLVLAGRRADALQALARLLPRTVTEVCDTSDTDQMGGLIARAVAKLGRLDAVVNNAATIEPIGHIHDLSAADWTRAVATNLLGPFALCAAVLPHFLRAGAGTIVNLTSGAADRPLDGWSAYCASKAALLMLTRSLAEEYGGRGVRVYGFRPGAVETPMLADIRRSGMNEISRIEDEKVVPPELPARVLAWLCSDAAVDLAGRELTIRDAALRARVGLPEREY
jgi:NAD(P)-dependent dehydrogenase (short-subunit alcohol dehydrogenase family)